MRGKGSSAVEHAEAVGEDDGRGEQEADEIEIVVSAVLHFGEAYGMDQHEWNALGGDGKGVRADWDEK
jgi:hypothetical protein